MKNSRRAWLVCIGCTLLLLCTIGLATSAFSVYQPYLIDQEGLSNAQASTVITVRTLFSLFAILSVTHYYRRFSLRTGVVLAASGTALSFLFFGLAHGFFMNCAAAAIAGLAYGYGGMIPASILIGRWFKSRQALALGICSAGTGVATIVAPPLVDIVIEHFSLKTAFWAEGIFVAFSVLLVFLLVHTPPEAQQNSASHPEESPAYSGQETHVLTKGETFGMLAAVVLIGTIANPGMAHLAVLYQSAGIDGFSTSLLLSLLGIALTLGKCLYGQITDHIGARRSGWLFFSLMILGQVLCCFANSRIPAVNTLAMLFLGVGLPLSTVGLSVFARDFSSPEQYASTMRLFQSAYIGGALVFGPVPGILADATGSYFPAFRMLTLFALLSMILVQGVYHRVDARKAAFRQIQHRCA